MAETRMVGQDRVPEGILKGMDFTPEEILVAKTILCLKGIFGIEARLMNPENAFFESGDLQMSDYVGNARKTLNQLTNTARYLAEEHAERLGISRERYEEIQDHVYSVETEL